MKDNYPYLIQGHMYQYDLHWIIDNIKNIWIEIDSSVELHTIKYADPIQWDITTQYQANTVVVDPKTGTAYISTKPVPSGILLTDTNYWTVVFNFQKVYTDIMKNISVHYVDGKTSTFDLKTNKLVWFEDNLYYALHDINIGDALVPDANIKKTTVEDMLKKSFKENMLNFIGDNRTTTLDNDILNVSGDWTVNVGDIAFTSNNTTNHVKQDFVEQIDGEMNTDITGNYIENVEGDKTTNAKEYFVNLKNRSMKLSEVAMEYQLNVINFGATGDGATDDTSSIQKALDALTENSSLFFPPGTYVITNTLIVPLLNNIKIHGNNSADTIILNKSLNNSFFRIGGRNKKISNVHLSGFRFDAVNSMSNGYAIEFINVVSWGTLNDIKIGSYGITDTSNVYKGISFLNTNVTVLNNFQIQAIKSGIEISSFTDSIASDLYINNGFIAHTEKGIHVGGGFGGLYIDNTLIYGGKVGYYESNELTALSNREIFLSDTVCIDGCDQYLARFDERLSNSAFIEFAAFLSGAGFKASEDDKKYACNLSIVNSPNARFSVKSNVIKSAEQDGINILDDTISMFISPETFIGYNKRYGIYCNPTYNKIKDNAVYSNNMQGDRNNAHAFNNFTPINVEISTNSATVNKTESSGYYLRTPEAINFYIDVTFSEASGTILQIGGLPYGAIEDTPVIAFDLTNNKPVFGFIPKGWNSTKLWYADNSIPSNCRIALKGNYKY